MSENTETGTEKKEKSTGRDIFDSIIVAFVIAVIIRYIFLGVYTIPTGSMLETLQIGDNIFVNQLAYTFSDPKHDDIVVFEYPIEPSKDFIKRVIGVPGDKIKISGKTVYRNGEELKPDYVKFDDSVPADPTIEEEFIVPKDNYLVMGDNRDNSYDGRYWGFVKRDKIIGKAFMIYWSSGPDGIRFDRIFNLIK